MSSYGSYTHANMTPTAHNICTCTILTIPSLNFGLPTYLISCCCWGIWAVYAMFYGRVLRKAEPFDRGVANTMLKVTHVGLYGFLC